MPGHQISGFDRARIIALHQQNWSNHRISASLGIPRTSVIRIVQRFQETGGVNRRPGSGRHRVTDEREDRYLANFVRRNRNITVTAVRTHFRRTYGRFISRPTIRRRLAGANLRSRRPLRVPRLTRAHRAVRLAWGRIHRNWLLPQWRNVLFSDESRFGLTSDSRRVRVWREPGHAARLAFLQEVVPYQGGTVMFWGGIMHGYRTPLIHIPETLTGNIYLENVIRPIVLPRSEEFGPNFIFMDDNARPHRTRRIQHVLAEANVQRMNWPAQSPDMNPIEHMWDMLSEAILRRPNPPITLQELIVAVLEEWNNIPQEQIDNLIRSMPRRVNQCIENRGGHTEY